MADRYGGVFEQDNIKYLIRSGTEAVGEGDYNTWTMKWVWETSLPYTNTVFFIDDLNEVFYLWYNRHFNCYNLSDHGVLFESSTDYVRDIPIDWVKEDSMFLGVVKLAYGGMSRSLQSYLLLCRHDMLTLEVWRGGVLLWSHLIEDDMEEEGEVIPFTGEISTTGKYILLRTEGTYGLVLYEGSKV